MKVIELGEVCSANGEVRIAYKILTGKCEEKKLLGRQE
jgi:hypothetical protein